MGESIFSPMVIDAIGEIMNISLGSSATAVSNMLDHRVDITTPTVRVINAEDFELGDVDPAVGVEIKYVCGLDGSNIMLLKRSDVKAIVDILLGSETPDEEFVLDELSISCVCELMNQMMGAASTAMSDFLGMMVNISTPESFELEDLDTVRREHFPVEKGPVVVVSFKLAIEGVLESEFMNVMSVELARDMVKGFGLEMDVPVSAEPEPAPAPAAESSGGVMSQEEIERLLSGGGGSEPSPAPVPAAESSGGVMSQEEIERLLSGGVGSEPAPAPVQQPQTPLQQPVTSPQMPPQAAPMGAEQVPGYPPQMPGGYPAYPPQAPGGYPYPPYPYYMYPPQQMAQPQPPEPKVINAKAPKMQELDDENRLNEEQQQNLDLIMSVSLEVAVEIGRTRRKIQDIIAFSKGSLVVLDKLAGDQVDLLVNGQCIARGDVVVIDDNFGIRITEILQKPDINELANP